MMYFLSSLDELRPDEEVLGEGVPVCFREILARFLMP